MTEGPLLIDDTGDEREWVSLPRAEVLSRIERMLTEDLVAFEIEVVRDVTVLGELYSFAWILTDENDEQRFVLLAARGEDSEDFGWWIHRDLVE